MKLAGVEEEENGRHGVEEEDPNDVLNFRISAQLRETLKAKGSESLFTIQAMTLDTVPDGSDLAVRARTGQIKILHQAIRFYYALICLVVYLDVLKDGRFGSFWEHLALETLSVILLQPLIIDNHWATLDNS
ncbi:DEAD box RNA helicase [Actinidia rufa]|uniref:DEAD box RNA helicase n=1 Tax=Actinidia rufa TaxID=165716 RepID=A0A7J0EBC9_9ERIC|nr:DEAD box RNA helicase [Actinidia rufa]